MNILIKPITVVLLNLLKTLTQNIKYIFLKKYSNSLKIIGAFAGGNFLASAISGVSGILYSQWISPEELGEFNKYGILTGYLGIGLIFVHGALPRQYPYLLGKGELEEAAHVSSAAKWWYLCFSWIGTAIFLALTLHALWQQDYRAVFGWASQIPALWMAIYGLYLQSMYRSSNDFVKLSNNQLVASITAFVLLALVKFFSYWGFLVRFFIQGGISVWIHERLNPAPVKAKFDLMRLKDLAKISLPLSVPAYIDSYMLNSSISFFVLTYLGKNSLGIYSWALMLQGMAMILVRAIHQIYVTKVTMKFGQTESISSCFNYSIKPTLISVGVSILIAIIFSSAIGPFIQLAAPNYVSSIPILKILIWQMPLFAAGLALIILTIALKYKFIIGIRLIKTAVTISLILLFHDDLRSIAMSIIAGDLVFYALGYCGLFIQLKYNNAT